MSEEEITIEKPRRNWQEKMERAVVDFGDLSIFSARTLALCFTSRPYKGTLIHSLYRMGVLTAPVVALTGSFIGMVLAMQSYTQYAELNLQSQMGEMINFSLIRELGPVLVAVMLAGRVGCPMAAELATMRTTEQVDALECLGVDPLHYLVVPRFLAAMLLVPLLTILAAYAGIMGGAYITINLFGVDSHHYWSHTEGTLKLWDVLHAIIKPWLFGAAIALVSCHRGLANRKGGAEGVGKAATQAFVISFIAILLIDFFVTMLLNTLEQL